MSDDAKWEYLQFTCNNTELLRISEIKFVCHCCKSECGLGQTISLGWDRPNFCIDCVRQALHALEAAG
jgi:hypothetical protein